MVLGHPVTAPYASGWLDVGDGNEIFWEEAGSPTGVPAVILHGGPGSGSSPSARQFFDPMRYRIISFDQRGCGRSRPNAAGENIDFSANTTAHLIDDIELLRAFLGVDRWVVYGASWGTTLGLAYAETHPSRVFAMVFAGVTMTRPSEIDWLYRGVAPHFPEAWAKFRGVVPETIPETGLIAAYNDLMSDKDPAVRDRAALAFHEWDFVSLSADPAAAWPERWNDPAYRLMRGRICTHYFRHGAWLAEGQLLHDAGKLAGIPGVLVQGQLDLQGPVETAEQLAAVWPDAALHIIRGAGHSTGDAGMTSAIVTALDSFARRLA